MLHTSSWGGIYLTSSQKYGQWGTSPHLILTPSFKPDQQISKSSNSFYYSTTYINLYLSHALAYPLPPVLYQTINPTNQTTALVRTPRLSCHEWFNDAREKPVRAPGMPRRSSTAGKCNASASLVFLPTVGMLSYCTTTSAVTVTVEL